MQEGYCVSKILNTEKRIVLHQFNCKVCKIHVYFCFAVLFVFLGNEKWPPLAYCGMENIWQSKHVNYNLFKIN